MPSAPLAWPNLGAGMDNFKERLAILAKHFLHCKRRFFEDPFWFCFQQNAALRSIIPLVFPREYKPIAGHSLDACVNLIERLESAP
jgi:hypothetical protein